MQSLRKLLDTSLDEIRGNRKLQYGILGIALLACGKWGLEWSDALSAKEKQLQQIRVELRALRSQSRDEDALRSQLAELDSSQEMVDERLWLVSSDAVGQARLKDWLTGIVKDAGARNFNLVLSSPRALGGREGSGESASMTTGAAKAEALRPSGSTPAEKAGTKDLREARATLTLTFTPTTLEQILFDIEGGQPLATVESLNVSRNDRKVEMTVRVLMRIGKQEMSKAADTDAGTAGEKSADAAAPAASLETTAPAAEVRP